MVSGELMIALRKSRFEQALVGSFCIFPGYQERRHQVGCGRTGSVGRRMLDVSVMDHGCSLPTRLGARPALPQLLGLLGWGCGMHVGVVPAGYQIW